MDDVNKLVLLRQAAGALPLLCRANIFSKPVGTNDVNDGVDSVLTIFTLPTTPSPTTFFNRNIISSSDNVAGIQSPLGGIVVFVVAAVLLVVIWVKYTKNECRLQSMRPREPYDGRWLLLLASLVL